MSLQLPLTLQYMVVALAVTVSAWVVLNKQFPDVARRLRIALALPLVRETRPAWMRALGKRIAPNPKPAGDGCGGCNNCDTGNAA
ncbi:MAG: hypothetical protein HOP03_11675 [Lysobacter sp.]|nr:hypothetical protein [Lysobacter sp.]